MTPFDPDLHKSWRDLPPDVELALALVFIIIMVAAFWGGR